MTVNTTPNLTDIVEQKFLTLIDDEELVAFENDGVLHSGNYIKLANLYHFQKEFEKEGKILERYTESQFADVKELTDIYERIDVISQKRHVLEQASLNKNVKDSDLSLTTLESEQEAVELSSNKEVIHQNKNTQTAIDGLTITVLSVCAVYTGLKFDDEIVELSLVLLEYTESKESPFSILKTYQGKRSSIKPIPNRLSHKFNLSSGSNIENSMNKEEILQMFLQANYVVSHNHADIERRHLVTLFPVLKSCKWYSTQKDIPWKALGFESTSLSAIIKSFGRRKPRTSMERAKAICQLLQHKESSTNDPLIERIHYMKPMQEIEWTDEMERQHKKMNNKQVKGPNFLLWFFTLSIIGVALAKYLKYW
ncbi:MAG: hypothetical protein L3J46_07810 [Kangiellaceae bacterium]|nr:hypothetical protein [Kangiellaceae bacterium]